MSVIRCIAVSDIPQTFQVRVATDENRLTLDQLAALGINENSVKEKLLGSYKGWLCKEHGVVVGFAMGDRSSGEMWVIAVLPSHICRGIGSALLEKVETWLFSEGCEELWLTTDLDIRLRAYSFYRKHGWRDWKIENGLRYMRKTPNRTMKLTTTAP
jgi:ribosomal protein S18 acetylase RimI-like enzyme